jgi:hypothetical protein
MHSKSGNLQSVWIMSPPLIESPSIIDFIFPSSRGNPSFSSPSFFVTDSSLNLLTKVGFASSHNPISEPCSGSVFPDSGSALLSPALFSPILAMFYLNSALFFLITDSCYPESIFLPLVADLNSLAPAFLCLSMHTYAIPNKPMQPKKLLG